MKIQPINYAVYCKNNDNKNCKINRAKTNTPSFKGYRECMHEALTKDLVSLADVAKCVRTLFTELSGYPCVQKNPKCSLVSEWILTKPTYFIREITKPIVEVKSDFRDVVLESEKENICILDNSDVECAYLVNFGKFGFINSLFNNQSARNDIRLVFSSDVGSFELGTRKDSSILAEQFFKSGYWEKSAFNPDTLQRVSHKTGDISDTVIFPPV